MDAAGRIRVCLQGGGYYPTETGQVAARQPGERERMLALLQEEAVRLEAPDLFALMAMASTLAADGGNRQPPLR